MTEKWKSPRKIEEEVRQYKHDRFERFMGQVDRGEISREIAIKAIESESLGDNIVIGEASERVSAE